LKEKLRITTRLLPRRSGKFELKDANGVAGKIPLLGYNRNSLKTIKVRQVGGYL
jgi:hypothetical protein